MFQKLEKEYLTTLKERVATSAVEWMKEVKP